MTKSAFHVTIVLVALGFSAYFATVVIPPFIEDPNIFGAFAAGFANPFASGYSADVIGCWLVLAAWISYEARSKSVRGGRICLLLGVVPGVAVGFAAYLIVRSRQLESVAKLSDPSEAT